MLEVTSAVFKIKIALLRILKCLPARNCAVCWWFLRVML